MRDPDPWSLPGRWYRVLLWCYPRDFRDRHGREMLRLFLERERDARATGKRVACWIGAAVDALKNGVAERMSTGGSSGGGMERMWKDVRHAVRSLVRAPGFTLVAVVTLALGIGANTAIFSVVRAVLLAPLPYHQPDRLAILWGEMRNRGVLNFPSSPPDFRDYREQADLLSDIGAVLTFTQPLMGDGEPVQVNVAGVTTNFFKVLGVAPSLGRDFTEEDGALNPGATGGTGGLPAVVLLSHAFWEQRYGGDRSILGRTIQLGGASAEVVGVVPEGVKLLLPATAAVETDPDIWLALRLDYANSPRNNVFLRPVARLGDGVTLEQAQAQVDGIAAGLAATDQVKASAGYAMRLAPMQADLTAQVRPILLALLGAVVFVLLIACANVSNLLLVRAGGRGRELAVRAAMGGSRARLIRQMLVESALLGLAGALVGVILAQGGVRMLLAFSPDSLPRVETVRVDGAVLVFTVLMAVASVLLFGTVPALQASRVDLADSLRDRTGGTGSAARRVFRNGVVVVEVALSMVLLIGAGLMVRSFVALTRVAPGYDPHGVLTMELSVGGDRYRSAASRADAMLSIRDHVAAVPGVTGVGGVFPLPLAGGLFNGRYGGEEALTDPQAFRQASYTAVLPGYFKAMGTRLLAGRTFADADHQDSTIVVVVDDKLAAKLWPGESAVGKRFLIRAITQDPEWVEVIGVVEHQRQDAIASEGMETVFLNDRYLGVPGGETLVVRADVDPLTLVGAIRSAVHDVDPNLPIFKVRLMDEYVDRSMAPTRFALTLIGIFGLMALVLASVGLYGVLSYVVRQRTAEIGVRMAFGAEAGRILRLVVGQGLALAGIGVVTGVLAAVPLTQAMSSILVSVSPTDPLTFGGISGLFLLVAGVACLLPALRASHVDPVVALREE